jgi:hypothetical protein
MSSGERGKSSSTYAQYDWVVLNMTKTKQNKLRSLTVGDPSLGGTRAKMPIIEQQFVIEQDKKTTTGPLWITE